MLSRCTSRARQRARRRHHAFLVNRPRWIDGFAVCERNPPAEQRGRRSANWRALRAQGSQHNPLLIEFAREGFRIIGRLLAKGRPPRHHPAAPFARPIVAAFSTSTSGIHEPACQTGSTGIAPGYLSDVFTEVDSATNLAPGQLPHSRPSTHPSGSRTFRRLKLPWRARLELRPAPSRAGS